MEVRTIACHSCEVYYWYGEVRRGRPSVYDPAFLGAFLAEHAGCDLESYCGADDGDETFGYQEIDHQS